MKKLIFLFLFSIFLTGAYAQNDSLAYQLQRKKINAMLAQRKVKFGQYDESLAQHTGIFGLQTKKDIRNSNDILMDIVKADDDIFTQLKVLLDYRAFQQKQVQNHSSDADSSNIGFMNTINKLRAENDQLKHEADLSVQEQQKKYQITMLIIIGLIVGILLLLRAKYVKKN